MALHNLSDHLRLAIEKAATERAAVEPFEAQIAAPAGAWHVIIAEPNREATAVRHLSSRGFGVYLPECDTVMTIRGRRRTFQKPMFPGYVFLFAWAIQQHRRRIEACTGVALILQQEAKDGDLVPVVISDRLILEIQATEFNQSRYGMAATRPRRKPRLNRWIEAIADDEIVNIRPKSYFSGIEKLADRERTSVLHRALGLVS